MKPVPRGNLKLGSNVVGLLLPQRRPFLMVDFVDAFQAEPVPTILAGRHVSANEGIFDGHFPGLHVWPGTFTIEGLGQAGVLLVGLLKMRRAAEAMGLDPEAALEALRNLEAGFRLQPGYRADEGRDVIAKLRVAGASIAVGTSVEMKFHRPVFAGQRLDYRVSLTGEHAGGVRFEAEASVEGTVVAAGVLGGALVAHPAFEGLAGPS
jgi:3-hydroxyacyl-[acyl-carrier-protein] dehydratase